jgi:hypothetical protein
VTHEPDPHTVSTSGPDRNASLTDTLRDALEALRREEFYESLARSEATLRADPDA